MKDNRLLNFVGALILCFTSPGFAASASADTPQQNSYRYQLILTTASGDAHHIAVDSINHEIVSPRDAASGLPSGKRQHKPYAITKVVDEVSPLIFNALIGNENITGWQLKFWRSNHNSKELQLYKTVTLDTPAIVGVVNQNSHGKKSRRVERETVLFTYKSIKWFFHDSGVAIEDDWDNEEPER